jgi:hypothetical protein
MQNNLQSRLPPISVANQAKAAAQRLRAEWLLRVATGESTIFDVIDAAESPFNEALLAIRLSALLGADRAVSRHRQKVIERVIKESVPSQTTHPPQKWDTVKVAWLYSKRGNPDIKERKMQTLYSAYLWAADIRSGPTETFPWGY